MTGASDSPSAGAAGLTELDKQLMVICSEKQARVIALPSQTCLYKVSCHVHFYQLDNGCTLAQRCWFFALNSINFTKGQNHRDQYGRSCFNPTPSESRFGHSVRKSRSFRHEHIPRLLPGQWAFRCLVSSQFAAAYGCGLLAPNRMRITLVRIRSAWTGSLFDLAFGIGQDHLVGRCMVSFLFHVHLFNRTKPCYVFSLESTSD